jgi:hypothetical protein
MECIGGGWKIHDHELAGVVCTDHPLVPAGDFAQHHHAPDDRLTGRGIEETAGDGRGGGCPRRLGLRLLPECGAGGGHDPDDYGG